MRTLAALLVLIALAFAQFEDVDQRLADCGKGCCAAAGYPWNASIGECHPGTGPNHLNYTACMNRCDEEAQRQITAMAPKSDFCFAPGFLIMAVPFAILWGKKSDYG